MRYDLTTIRLHWLTASLVALLWLIGQAADLVQKGALQNAFWSMHVFLGFFLSLVLIGRFLWRASAGHTPPPVSYGMSQTLAKMSHYLLYSLLLLAVGLGLLNAFIRGHDIFGIVHLPRLAWPDWKPIVGDLHEWVANALIIVALIHAVIALVHHFVLRDDVLRHMTSRSNLK